MMPPIVISAHQVAERVVTEGVAPSAAAGCSVLFRGPSPETDHVMEVGGATELLFDLASVTKPMMAVAVAWGGVDPATPLGALLPEARGTASEQATLELLLAHRAGLRAHTALWGPMLEGKPVDAAAALREAANARRDEAAGPVPEGGFSPVYSDLGYALAGAAAARALGMRDAGEVIERVVLDPLGLSDRAGTVRGLAARGVLGPFAPTETVAWRGGPVVGAVHDENAWALTGEGGSGHAGIFARVDAVLRFGVAVLERIGELEWLVRERPGGSLRAGFDGKSAEPGGKSSAGERMGPRAFGHLGFTGTSLWIDPDSGVVVSLLTNRVCPSRDHVAIRAARPWAHDALVARAGEIGGR